MPDNLNTKSEGQAMKISVEKLKPNNVIDLEGDKYADPDNDNTWIASDLSVIEAVDILPFKELLVSPI